MGCTNTYVNEQVWGGEGGMLYMSFLYLVSLMALVT